MAMPPFQHTPGHWSSSHVDVPQTRATAQALTSALSGRDTSQIELQGYQAAVRCSFLMTGSKFGNAVQSTGVVTCVVLYIIYIQYTTSAAMCCGDHLSVRAWDLDECKLVRTA
jgi:hypothetical protein